MWCSVIVNTPIHIKTKPKLQFYRIPRNILIDYLKTEGITYEIPPENCHTLRYKIWHFLEVPKVKFWNHHRWRRVINNLNSVITRCQNVTLFQHYFNIGFCFHILCWNIASFATKVGSHFDSGLLIGRPVINLLIGWSILRLVKAAQRKHANIGLKNLQISILHKI